MRRERVLVVGGGGFIGSHLAARHLDRGDDVHAVVRPTTSTRRLEGLAGPLELHRLSLGDRDALDRLFATVRPERVVYLAACTRRAEEPDLQDMLDSISEDLANLARLLMAAAAARPSPRIVIRAGSLAEYGAGPAPFSEGQREVPLDPYSAALVAGTHYARMIRPRLAFPVITARLALVYGPGQSREFLVPLLIERCISGEKLFVRHPSDRRDLMHVDDAVDALVRLADAPVRDIAEINIGTGVAPSMREVAGLIVQATGADARLVEFGSDAASSGIPEFRATTDIARRLLGWNTRIPLAMGLQQTIRWYRDHLLAKETVPC